MAATLTSDDELTYVAFPIEKVEQTADGHVTVWGKATDDSVDSDEQIVDSEFAAKALAGWMDTGPNVRVQHQAQRDPAGVGLTVERDGTAHWVKSKIIEPVAKQLVLGGALRAYSVGIARPTIQRDAKARGGRITDGMIVEISLVDRPANKNCGIQLVKMAATGGYEFTGKVFGSDDMIAKAMNSGAAAEDVTLTVPSDIQMSFTPLDMAKIIARKNGNGNGSLTNFITKTLDEHAESARHDAAREYPAALEKAQALIEEREYDETFSGKRKLTAETRGALSSSDFVFPETRKYPIHDRSHARNALSRVAANGTPDEQAKVRAAVSRRYPGMGKKAAKKAAAMVASEALPDMTKPTEKKDKAACAGCGAMQNNKHAFCSECGKSMAAAMPVAKNHDFMCLKCGYKLDKGEKFCPSCGNENPGHNPMADQKIPTNKAEGSRVADELVVTETAEKKKKPKGDRVASKPGQMPGEDEGSYTGKAKKKKGNPFGGKQSPPFGAKPDGDDDDADKALDPQSGPSSMPRAGGTPKSADAPVTASKGKKKKGGINASSPGAGVTGAGAAAMKPLPAPLSSDPEAADFNRNPGDIQVKAAMRLKSLGVTQEDGFLHDLSCPAYSWDDVAKAYPDGLAGFSAKAWQDKALEIAASAPLAQAKSAVMLGQHAYTLKNASLTDIIDVKNDLYKAFRDANPGPGSFPSPGEICATTFQRPKIESGRAAYSHQYDGPNSAKVPDRSIAASQFGRGYLSGNTASESPSNKGEGAPYPSETGRPMVLDYTSIHKTNVLDAMRAMHDHFDRVMPSGVCPFVLQDAPAPNPAVAAKSGEESVVQKKVSADGMTKKQRVKMRKKLTKKVMSGKMPLDQARIRMGKKPMKSPEPLAPHKAAGPDVTKAFDTDAMTKAFAAVLRKSQKVNDKKIAALTRAVDALADQPDPGTQPFKGIAFNPIRKSASPAGIQEIAGVAERTQMMVLRELEDTARNGTDPAQREAAWNQILKMKGLT